MVRLACRQAAQGAAKVAISVEDSGPGVDQEEIARIFDPFVTTKASGIGLGLAICRMIVEQHGGHLLASSERDQGARFEVVLRFCQPEQGQLYCPRGQWPQGQ
ncbi:ATP-binding protein [Mesorhizobium sp. M2E.F.Ca.ET.209.01.1.1]|nr:ATP-binding protein [Mesorhizobium sp. M2E.F.Ca.ET.209.01.1.1]TGS09671.1 ATP-binding protein [Mesorhizobium sp. M2E.F.Ca.ET.209.01.1.1]